MEDDPMGLFLPIVPRRLAFGWQEDDLLAGDDGFITLRAMALVLCCYLPSLPACESSCHQLTSVWFHYTIVATGVNRKTAYGGPL